MGYVILVDTREKDPWRFYKSTSCDRVSVATLPTADYTLEGFENILAIERKGSILEFAHNIVGKDYIRFEKELDRLTNFKYAYVILCFSASDIINYPKSTNLPSYTKKKIKITGPFLMRRFLEVQNKYKNINFVLAGAYGKEIATSIFKQVYYDSGGQTQENGTDG